MHCDILLSMIMSDLVNWRAPSECFNMLRALHLEWDNHYYSKNPLIRTRLIRTDALVPA